jgi:hypothetical protein
MMVAKPGFFVACAGLECAGLVCTGCLGQAVCAEGLFVVRVWMGWKCPVLAGCILMAACKGLGGV